jgi:hypothetical protein
LTASCREDRLLDDAHPDIETTRMKATAITKWGVCRVAVLRDTPQAYVFAPAAPRLGNPAHIEACRRPTTGRRRPNASAILAASSGSLAPQLAPARGLVPRVTRI